MRDRKSNEQIRQHLAGSLHRLREGAGWSQDQVAAELGVSPVHLAAVEAGDASLSAEQLLVAIGLFQVDVADLLPPVDPGEQVQNALIRHGAAHLRLVPGVIVPAHLARPDDVVRQVLLAPEGPRHVCALAPIVARALDRIHLPYLRLQLEREWRQARLGWLLENISIVLQAMPRQERQRSCGPRVAWTMEVIQAELDRLPCPDGPELDLFDRTIRSARSREETWARASPTSRRWRLVTEIQPADFAVALRW
jgi:transcriptional regulator with XRE-family HTH domain